MPTTDGIDTRSDPRTAGARGLVVRVRNKVGRVIETATDRWRRVDTAEEVALDAFGLDRAGRIWYDASSWGTLRSALRRLDVRPSDVFIDLGSGKGRGVLVACAFPFRRVIGLELSPELTAIARRNVERGRFRSRTSEVELVTADITTYELPDDVTVVYMFCPLYGEGFDSAVDAIIRSVDRAPRPVRIVYNYPYEHDRLVVRDRIMVFDVRSSRWPAGSRLAPEVIVTYLVLPPAGLPRGSSVGERARRNLRGAQEWLGPYNPGFLLIRTAPADVS